ncbi:hypothetical protein CDV31_010131 [Fusarium ambrosium]|uniref:Aminoglycoside phosphotransferase domain-containing protein n=1 Tax=Fusarium ambrosium TaxID=131363 RepID=A0A428TQK2_9HYPO|nr:hypothetical protein CDV31_010131 [Fusarium ambrosium]
MSITVEIEDDGAVDYEWAINQDANILERLKYLPARNELYNSLWTKRKTICSLIRHHLGLDHRDICNVASPREWIQGSFNVCIPVEVQSNHLHQKYILQCCLPHKLAETSYPGTMDEKLRCEVGAYTWMQESCPDIRVPYLFGFGFSDDTHFTHEEYRPWYFRLARTVQRCLCALLRFPDPSRYTTNPMAHCLPTAYMLLEHIGPDTGQMLSITWDKRRSEPQYRERLFRGLARVILSLARIPQPRIGSLRFNNNCSVTLTNRPLTHQMVMLENEGIPRTMGTTDTYPSAELYVTDMLTFYDNCLLSNPNAVFDDEDCREKMAVKTLLRALSHRFIRRETRNGPFILQLTDLHASNVFVDDEWNLVCLVDLEWICALPSEMLAVPCWLTGHGVDELEGELLEEFEEMRLEFMRFFEEEEQELVSRHSLSLANIMDETWTSKGVWFWHCIKSLHAMTSLARAHICPQFSTCLTSVAEILSKFWCVDSHRMVEKKVTDLQRYEEDLRHCFDRDNAN